MLKRESPLRSRALGLALLCLGLAACSGREPVERLSPSARPEILEELRADLAAPRHAADGGGRAWIEAGDDARAGSFGSWTLVFEAGELGIAEGGAVYLQVSPFWGWSTPQTESPTAPGYTVVSTGADGVELDSRTAGNQLLIIRIGGRALAAGERVRIIYGAGPIGARTDHYAERDSMFWFAVDGDGDGIRALIAESPRVRILAGEPARLAVRIPSTAAVGEPLRGSVAVLDVAANAAAFRGEIALASEAPGLDVPSHVSVEGSGGHATFDLVAREAGIFRVSASVGSDMAAVSNPILVAERPPRVLWADLHGHSGLSDGTGTPAEYFSYARDVAALDAVALTDHDHWGMQPLARHPEIWQQILEETRRFHAPGEFITLPGYEWTSWTHGHRHVLYFDGEEDAGLYDSVDEAFDHPRELWEALGDRQALTFAHHSAGGPVATNWEIPPHPKLEPITEIVSVHGVSEALDAPSPIYEPIPGNFVRDVLDRGFRLGFIGSGDSHDGHPGLTHLASPGGGLAAIFAREKTREAVLEALRARHAYATNGPRIVLLTTLGGLPMGSLVPPGPALLTVRAVGTAPIVGVDLVQRRLGVQAVETGDSTDVSLQLQIADLRPGDYFYVRVRQDDGGLAWSSPYFVDSEATSPDPS